MRIDYYPPGELASTIFISKKKYIMFLEAVYNLDDYHTDIIVLARELWKFNRYGDLVEFIHRTRLGLQRFDGMEIELLKQQYPEYVI